MKILILSSVFPPRIIGGAELSAYNLGIWLSKRGHEVGVLTVAENNTEEIRGEVVNGMRIWRLCSPHIHTQHAHRGKTIFQKLVWHAQDHFDPRNKTSMVDVIEEFKPDSINIHVLQGLGHNALSEVSRHNIPIIYFLHDLGLACLRQNLYKRDKNCYKQCFTCHLSSVQKMKQVRRIRNLQFVSPSRSNLETLRKFVDLSPYATHVVPNLDLDESCKRHSRMPGSTLRFLYVGKIDRPKGVEFLLRVFDKMTSGDRVFNLSLTVVGGGPSEESLRSTYANRSWLTFAGKVTPSEVRAFMQRSDALLLPSLWRENHPGVVRQALRSGIPAVVSDSGGSKEMIIHGESGLVAVAGDEQSWTKALSQICSDETLLLRLQEGADKAGRAYSADVLGEKILELISIGVENAKKAACDIASARTSPGSTAADRQARAKGH